MPTPILPTDRVHDVLARDIALIEVLVRHSPHFARLRNPAMRRTMARLVTVEQAARIASVDSDVLVRALNDALGIESARTTDAADPATPSEADAAAPRRPSGATEVELDVRDDLRTGREPFSRIMAAVAALGEGEVLRLRTIFEPAPLYAVLGRRGFDHESLAHAPDDWSVCFWRAGAQPEQHGRREDIEAQAAPATPEPVDTKELWLDVRGLEPPEPMVRTLAALETLPAGHTLVQVNVRVPRFLLPVLAERRFDYQIDETRPDRVLVRIRRSA